MIEKAADSEGKVYIGDEVIDLVEDDFENAHVFVDAQTGEVKKIVSRRDIDDGEAKLVEVTSHQACGGERTEHRCLRVQGLRPQGRGGRRHRLHLQP
jgi:hypothetical protein